MSYYNDKRQLLNQIIEIFKKNKKVKKEDLYFFALKTYGFGSKAVDSIISMLIARNLINWLDEEILEYLGA